MRPRRTLSPALIVAAVTSGVLITAMCTAGASGPLASVVPAVIVGGAVGATIWTVRRARADRADYERRLTAWAASEAVLAERLHIARDLHDIVSHGLGLITVRAAATRHLPKSPQVTEALTDIEEASRTATAELRRMLGVLRSTGPLTPVDGLDDLAAIVADAGRTGLRVELTVGELGPVSPGVQVAVARTVREGLANAARHAGPCDVRVQVHRDREHLVVTVADGGPAPGWRATPGAGHGLAGLRERVGSLGGVLSAAAVDGGFRVSARIPDAAS
ncbi:sensor histidine kinase [Catenuloplanes indicus]|uniref:histidine kinase n=1 Tax=Catenuloplanes indicus TaxID=137267 RepID=A0AAE3VTX2_9ACTN|nr:histidine kinase [Catenuloplanes indicus]MDQ0364153.1 signal transduction histidine kinase [Catenuloplanes indicus]